MAQPFWMFKTEGTMGAGAVCFLLWCYVLNGQRVGEAGKLFT